MEFNPATVGEYRLLGYETRLLRREDFNNDAVDAGDIGAGHAVTALYEITPAGSSAALIDERRYQRPAPVSGNADEYGFLKIRYKLPDEDESRLLSTAIPLQAGNAAGGTALREARFAAAVAGFAQLLRGGQHTGSWRIDDAIELARANRGADNYGYRSEFVQLMRQARIASDM